MHQIAESKSSRKLPLSIVQPYALGPGLSAVLGRPGILEAGTLIHPRIKIRSRVSEKTSTHSLLSACVSSGSPLPSGTGRQIPKTEVPGFGGTHG